MDSTAYFSAIQQAILTMMLTSEPAFLRWGFNVTIGFATIRLIYLGYQFWFNTSPHGDPAWSIAKTMLSIAICYACIVFYVDPMPVLGVSLSGLVVEQTGAFANTLDAAAVSNTYRHWTDFQNRFIEPGGLEVVAGMLYVGLMITMAVVKALSIAVVSFGLIASAVCALLGPLFVPFLLFPKFTFLFYGWLRAFIQYSFIPVVAYAFLLIFDHFLVGYLTTLPPNITSDLIWLYGIQGVGVGATFIVGIVLVPSLTASIFSGGGAQSVAHTLLRFR